MKALVVCIDDEQVLLTAIGRLLKRDPALDVRTTADAEQVLQWIATEDVAVLVSDYEMPQMNGAQLASKARQIRPETTRILLTGSRMLETAIDGINQGEVFRFISKPFDDKTLTEAIHAGIARHEELVALSGERQRRERRDTLRQALEADFPGITDVKRSGDVVVVTDDPWLAAIELGLAGLDRSHER